MKNFFLEVDGGPRAGPISQHLNNFVLTVFDKLPDVQIVETFTSLDAETPSARYLRDGPNVVWHAPIRSRRIPQFRTVTDKVSGEKRRVRVKDPKVRRSPHVGEWRVVGALTYVEGVDAEVRGPSNDKFLADLIEDPYAL